MKALILISALATLGCYPQHSRIEQEKQAIQQTIVRMVNAIDKKAWDEAEQEFTEDIFTDYSELFGQPGTTVKTKALINNWKQLLQAPVQTHHMLSNFEIQLNGDQAESYTHVYATHTQAGITHWDVFGRYHHKLTQSPTGWKITSMKLLLHGQKGNTNFFADSAAQLNN